MNWTIAVKSHFKLGITPQSGHCHSDFSLYHCKLLKVMDRAKTKLLTISFDYGRKGLFKNDHLSPIPPERDAVIVFVQFSLFCSYVLRERKQWKRVLHLTNAPVIRKQLTYNRMTKNMDLALLDKSLLSNLMNMN